MFTGIIESIGKIKKIVAKEDIHQYRIQTQSEFVNDLKEGDSVAVNGVCLTVYDIDNDSFKVDVSQETQSRTSFGYSKIHSQANLERAVTPSIRLGGHFVTGHVDGMAELIKRKDNANEAVLWFKVPQDLMKYIAVKGSLCINGVSLTINEIKDDQFCVTVIPHTLKMTTLAKAEIHDMFNIEVDLLARYLEQLMKNN